MPVYRLMDMPVEEYQGWLMFYAERQRKEDADRGNLLAADDSGGALLKGFGL